MPLSSGRTLTVGRVELFDARFQTIASDGTHTDGDTESIGYSENSSVIQFFDTPSDLVPGIYEGGLKTWECSLDLVDYLDGIKDDQKFDIRGKRVFEVRSYVYFVTRSEVTLMFS